MGQGQSTQSRLEVIDGVRVTQSLLEQLSGSPRHSRKVLGLSQQRVYSNQDEQLGPAIHRSRQIGGLLLKDEEAEMKQIHQLANNIIKQEYSTPHQPQPCGDYAEACTACYKLHPDDPLQCALAVDAYTACAKKAWTAIID